MDPSEGFAGFVTVVDTGSVSAAARELGMPRPTLSRQLARLEARLGVRLLHRGTRRLALTEPGRELYGRARQVLQDAVAAVQAVQRQDDVPRGVLRVSAPPNVERLAPLVASFVARWPEVRVELTAETRHVDLVQEGYHVAIRGGVVRDPSLIVRRLARTDSVVVASAAWISAHGAPTTLEALAGCPCLLGFAEGRRPESTWPLRGGGEVPVYGRLVTNDLHLRWRATLDGGGLSLLPRLLIEEDLAAGRLVTVLEDQVGFETVIALVYPERAHLDPKVRAFVDHVAEGFTAAGWVRPTRLPTG